MIKSNDLIYIAGHTGLIGSALVRRLKLIGLSNLLLINHSDLELTDPKAVNIFFENHKPAYVFLAAGRVGGIEDNQISPADYMSTNLSIQLNILNAAHHNKAKKLILFGSSCMYPRECPQPMNEELLLTGKLEPSSIAYAMAKLAGLHMCLAYNKQFGKKKFIPVIPNSAYGPYDNFSPESGHVLSVLIKKFHEAKKNGSKVITLWGSGNARREFIHSDDIADASIYIMNESSEGLELPINIGVEHDYSIRELAELIAEVVGYSGIIGWDVSKPDGAARKLLDSKKLKSLGWKNKISFHDGLVSTYKWYLENEKV